jgi:hypothetical protein
LEPEDFRNPAFPLFQPAPMWTATGQGQPEELGCSSLNRVRSVEGGSTSSLRSFPIWRHLFAFSACLRQADRDGLLPTLDGTAFSAGAALEFSSLEQMHFPFDIAPS